MIEISYNVLYVWHCMELYDKKFLIYGICIIRSFGHPGHTISFFEKSLIIDFLCNFWYVWNCMKSILMIRFFLIYENCMTSFFGQPGSFVYFFLNFPQLFFAATQGRFLQLKFSRGAAEIGQAVVDLKPKIN